MTLKIKYDGKCHAEYIATQKFNKLTWENFTSRWAWLNLASKNYIADSIKNTDRFWWENKKFE